jgi:hypothetical protein
MFNKNMDLVKKRFPQVYQELLKETADPDLIIEVSQSRTGLPVVSVTRNGRKLYLNSPYDPELDARRWAENNRTETSGCCYVLCGGGFLYHLKALLEAASYQKIIVYEPNIEILKACLQVIDWEPLLENNDWMLLTGSDYDRLYKETITFFGGIIYSGGNMATQLLPPYQVLFQEEIGGYLYKVKEWFQVNQSNLVTLDGLAKDWLSNAFKTLPNALNSPVIRHYFGQFENIPAIVVSAGPSLEKNIHLLKDLKEKALIICAGSSIRAMKRNGVSPHLLIAVDTAEINNSVYNDLTLDDVYLVYNFRFNHGVVTRFSGKKILFKAEPENIPDLLITKNRGTEIGTLRSGFSVSHSALDLAVKMGCNPVILIGQDLAYTGNKRYAEGQIASSVERYQKENAKLNWLLTKDIYGQDIMTDRGLDNFRIIFEKMIANFDKGKVNVINATEGGLNIQGTVNRKLHEVIAECCLKEQGIGKRIQSLYEQGLKEIRKHPIDAVAYCSKLKSLVERGGSELVQLVERGQQLRKLNLNSEFDPGKLEPVLQQIASDYDLVLHYTEYHALLKDFQVSALSVMKARLTDEVIKTKEEYDQRIQIYLHIIINTKKYLDFIMECIDEFLQQYHPVEKKPILDQGAIQSLAKLETQIKRESGLKDVTRQIESVLRNPASPGRGAYLYLYSLILLKTGERERTIVFLEQAVKEDNSLGKAYFLLFRLYSESHNNAKAIECLSQCCQLNYKKKYCRKVMCKLHYRAGDYVAAINSIAEYRKEYPAGQAPLFLQAECLRRLELISEARQICRMLRQKYGNRKIMLQALENLFANDVHTEYETRYLANQKFFTERCGLILPEYSQIQNKVCRYLSGEFLYNRSSGQIFSGINQAAGVNLSIDDNDVVAVFNTDNTKVFERFLEIFTRIDSVGYRKKMASIPVFVIDQDPEQWYFISQLFDFNALKDWTNLHFLIFSALDDLKKVFLAENTPFPNIMYGTQPEEFEQFILEIKRRKDDVFGQRLARLTDYYRDHKPEQVQKVLIVGSIIDEVLIAYGKALQSYLNACGMDCYLDVEAPPFYQRTVYGDAKLLDEFRPDLVIHLLGTQEEFAVFGQLPVPFVSWLFFDKEIAPNPNIRRPNQRFLLTGNLSIGESLLRRGHTKEQIYEVPLPTLLPMDVQATVDSGVNEIGIYADLDDFEELMNNLGIVIYGLFFSKGRTVFRTNISAAIRAIYFAIYTNHRNEILSYHEVTMYEELLADHFRRNNLPVDREQLQLIAPMIKKEFEKLLLAMLQAKWIMNDLPKYGTELYGSGWDKDPGLKGLHRSNLNSVTDIMGFQQAVLRNKVNIYLGARVNNKSYMQPDLINGLAAGGFFLVNDLLVKEFGPQVLEPFGGLLETYGSRAELREKCIYFLEHETERLIKAKQLQEYVQEHFDGEKIFSSLIRDF